MTDSAACIPPPNRRKPQRVKEVARRSSTGLCGRQAGERWRQTSDAADGQDEQRRDRVDQRSPHHANQTAAVPRFQRNEVIYSMLGELSRRRLLPAVSPAAGHLTTPTVAGLPGLCENFRPTTSTTSPIERLLSSHWATSVVRARVVGVADVGDSLRRLCSLQHRIL